MSWKVYRRKSTETVTMCKGEGTYEEPAFRADVYLDGQHIGTVYNWSLLCLPGGSIRAPDATDKQIAAAVLGDEHVYDTEADGSVATAILAD